MKQGFRYLCAIAAFMLVFGAFSFALGQTASATPDPFIAQLTSSPAGFSSYVGDITANGRFVVFESNGDVATQNRNNADGNREIFLIDYAQRRIFQLTNTKNVPKPTPTPSPSPTPSPAPSPTPTPAPTPADPAQIRIEISNNRPMISFDPEVVLGKRTFTIVFSSNAPTLPFDGTEGSLALDGNQELWIYQIDIPGNTDVDLTTGDEIFQDLSLGTFKRLTVTTPSLPIIVDNNPPVSRDDNREAFISDNGNVIAFISVRDLVTGGNTDSNPELFFARTSNNWSTFAITQGTNTQNGNVGPTILSRFQQNPSLSANGSRVAFLSTANLAGNNADDSVGRGNAEVYVADVTGSGLSNIFQVTRTKPDATTVATVNFLMPGRRISRDGAYVAFESTAEDPKANTTTNTAFLAPFVYNVSADTFARVGPRALTSPGDIRSFPSFTDYIGLTPGTVIFVSALNFKTDGTFPAADQDATGLNILRQPQVFATALPVSSSSTFTRLTNNTSGLVSDVPLRPVASSSRRRTAFTIVGADLGGGNADLFAEIYYLLSPPVNSNSAEVLSFFTGASNFPVATATPTATPTPSPTPTPTPGTVAVGLAPGELSIVRAAVALAPANKDGVGGSETERSPILPVELAGVSVSVNGAAAGLYFVGNAPSEIVFVMPVSLTTGVATVVVNNNGTAFRGFVQINPAQPDIFTLPSGPGGIAMVCNVTNPMTPNCVGPFSVTSPDSTGALVPTVLEIYLTGVRAVLASEAKVTIGTTDINATLVRSNTNMFGFDFITITLPASLAGAGNVPMIVTVTKSGTFTSRPADTAPRITIN
ncbi:MAG: hypothetical protein ACR2HX_21740 [Pyrinomonadaceae bacterium]